MMKIKMVLGHCAERQVDHYVCLRSMPNSNCSEYKYNKPISDTDNIHTELDKHTSDMDNIKTELDKHNSDINNIQTEFDKHNSDMDNIQTELDKHNNSFGKLCRKVR